MNNGPSTKASFNEQDLFYEEDDDEQEQGNSSVHNNR